MKNKKAILLIFLFCTLSLLISNLYFTANESKSEEITVINDRNYAKTVLKELNSAEKSIHVSMFSLTYYLKYPNSKVNYFLKALSEKHQSGVDIKIIIDEFPEDHEAGMSYLKEQGVPIKYDGKNQTTHTKLIIIDKEKVIVGSTNWRYYSIEKNHEANVLIESTDTALQFENYFEEIWNESSG